MRRTPAPRVPRLRGDGGAIIVESALVMPLVLFLMFGLVDLGLATFETAQAAGAARDGARLAILWPADPTGSQTASMTASVRAAALDHLDEPDRVTAFSVRCLKGPTGTTPVACGIAEPGTDRVVTSVSWRFYPATFLGGMLPFRTITGTSTMFVVGRPMAELASTPTSSSTLPTTTTSAPTTTTSSPDPTTTTTVATTTTTAPTTTSTLAPVTTVAACTANVVLEPTHGKLVGGGQLNKELKLTITINGSGACASPSLRYFVDAGDGGTRSATATMAPTSQARTYTATIPKYAPNGWEWEVGSHKLEVTIGGTRILTTPATFNVT